MRLTRTSNERTCERRVCRRLVGVMREDILEDGMALAIPGVRTGVFQVSYIEIGLQELSRQSLRLCHRYNVINKLLPDSLCGLALRKFAMVMRHKDLRMIRHGRVDYNMVGKNISFYVITGFYIEKDYILTTHSSQ